ncbi:MAG: hydrogenase/urease maturation nickel metallochaperone HypA [Nitrososphaerota archaeon]|nr:hydrogenase/urease maturation nickel metallochaperone HypA [Nitrososphaerota archaeon]
MHEFVIARGVVESLREFSLRTGRRVSSFRVLVGELSMLNLEVLGEALGRLVEESEVRGASFTVDVEPAEVGCGSCGHVMSFGEAVSELGEEEKEAIHFLPDLIASFTVCRRCGSHDLRVVSGRGVSVRDVTGTE